MRPKIRLLVAVLLALSLAGIGSARPTFAAASCPSSESNLQSLMSAGGTVSLSCSSPTTISFSGAINVSNSVTLDASSSPGAITFDGGGAVTLFAVQSGGSLTVQALTLQNASPSPNGPPLGPAITNSGSTTLIDSTVTGNRGGIGGALYNQATMTVVGSTLSANSSNSTGGGAIWNQGTMSITNSTFVGNTASSGSGGAIYNEGGLTIRSSTFSGNSASRGSALYNFSTIDIAASIIANSTGQNCAAGPLKDSGYNLEWSGTGHSDTCGFSSASHDITGTDPLLDARGLQSNGGPTQTIALAATSPAIDGIPASTTLCPTTDQRGTTRPDDKESFCDMGAYEVADPPVTVTITGSPASPTASASASFTFSGSGGGGTLTDTCQLDSGTATSCTSPKSYSNLASGSHTFTVTATDPAGNSGSAHDTWTVDTVAPVVTITPSSEPANPTTSTSATFAWTGSDPYDSITGYTCQLDGGTATSCASPQTYSRLARGSHTFTVTATDRLGNSGSVSYQWTVDAPTTTFCPSSESDLQSLVSAGGTVSLSCSSPTTISLSSDIVVDTSVTLDASGSPQPITFDGGYSTFLFNVGIGVSLTLNTLTLQHGECMCAINGNVVPGAILSLGTVNIINSTLTANGGSAVYSDGGYGYGTLTITNSTISNNAAGHYFGGGVVNSRRGTLVITNSTLYGNSSGRAGGAIFNGDFSNATITNSTIADNSVPSSSPYGSAIDNSGGITLSGTIIAGNTGGGNCDNEIRGSITSNGYNLTDSNGNCGLASSTDLTNTNPELDPSGLQSNGAPASLPPTVALEPGSPAIDGIPTGQVGCPGMDERGVARPDDSESACDIGAYESDILPSSLSSVSGSGTYGGTATLTATLTAGSTNLGGESISFTLNGSAVCGGSTGVTCPTTNGSGVATLSNVSLTGVTAGSYPTAIGASFGGTVAYSGSSGTGPLLVSRAPTITSANATTFTVGTNGTFTVTTGAAFPSPPTLNDGGATLPSGVTLKDNGDGTATLSGTPAAGTGGTYTFTITATNGISPDAMQTFTLTVNEAASMTSANSTTFKVGTNGTFTVTTFGYPHPTLSDGGAPLPSGVTFTDNGDGTATLSGTPAAGTGGQYTFTITAHNSSGSDATQSFTLTVNEAPTITSSTAYTFVVGHTSTFTVTTSHSYPTPTLSESGALPGGVTFTDNKDGTATISGAPAAGSQGNYPLTITADNGVSPSASQGTSPSAPASASQSFTLTVSGPTIAVVKSFTATRSGNLVAFRWHLVQKATIAGFNLYAGKHQLNTSLIKVHTKMTYNYHVTWTKHSHFVLDVLLTDGAHIMVKSQ